MAEKAVGLGLIFTNPLILVILLAFSGIMIAIAYSILWVYGLVTATITFIGGALLIYIVGRVSPDMLKSYPVLFLVPFGFGCLGFVIDHMPTLAMLSIAKIDVVTGDFVVDPLLLAGLLFSAMFAVIGLALITSKKKPRKLRKKKR